MVMLREYISERNRATSEKFQYMSKILYSKYEAHKRDRFDII